MVRGLGVGSRCSMWYCPVLVCYNLVYDVLILFTVVMLILIFFLIFQTVILDFLILICFAYGFINILLLEDKQ